MIESIVLAISLLFIVSGIMFGFLRGLNRSIFRLVLIITSVVLSALLCHKFSYLLLDIQIDGQTLNELILTTISSLEIEISDSIMNLIMAIIEMVVGILMYFVIFYLLKFLTLIILYPIGKLFILKGKNPKRLLGAIVGLVQGVVICFAVCVPLSGLLMQFSASSNIKIGEQNMLEFPQELNLEEYSQSSIASMYANVGNWFFESITTVEMENGSKVNFNDAINIIESVIDLGNVAVNVGNNIGIVSSNESTLLEKLDALKNLGDNFVSMGQSVDDMTDNAKQIINEIVPESKEMFGVEDEQVQESFDAFFNDFDIEEINFASVGTSMHGIATYMEKTSDEIDNDQPVEQNEINEIVNGLADNIFLLDFAANNGSVPQIIDANEHSDMFDAAISSTQLNEQDKNKLRQLFGLPVV